MWAVRPPLLPPDLSDVKTAKDLLIILMLFELPGLPGAGGVKRGESPLLNVPSFSVRQDALPTKGRKLVYLARPTFIWTLPLAKVSNFFE